MNPIFFGPSHRQLFGVYHPPRGAPRDLGVVLCYPAPQEYMRTHWAMRRLATLLAQRGFHALRFDYYATGDSAGDSSEAGIDSWRDDIGVAVSELKDVAGVNTVSLVGLRLGAALAAQASAAGLSARDLVLWEPVVRGGPYLEELRSIAVRKFARLMFHESESDTELIGYPFLEGLERDTRAIDLFATKPKAKRTLLISSDERPEHRELVDHLTAQGLAAKRAEVRDETSGGGGMQREAALLSTAALQAIVSSLEEQ